MMISTLQARNATGSYSKEKIFDAIKFVADSVNKVETASETSLWR